MTEADFVAQFDRLGRYVDAARQNAGAGGKWTVTDKNGETHTYVLRGLRSHAEAEDALVNLLLGIWMAKNYLTERSRSSVRMTNIEAAVDRCTAWPICIDLANRIKHPNPTRSRTDLFPRLGPLSYHIPQVAVRVLTIGTDSVTTEVASPEAVTLRCPVIDQNGNELGDAFDLAATAISTIGVVREHVG